MLLFARLFDFQDVLIFALTKVLSMHMDPAKAKRKGPIKILLKESTPYIPAVTRI